MVELKGKYNSCKVFTDNVDNETISQLTALLNQKSVNGSQIRIMPDCHSGKGCVIGTTMTLTDKVVPNLVGVDIGCFVEDTEVYMSDGTYKTFKELHNQGGTHRVCSYDVDNKEFKDCNAVAKLTRRNANLVCVRYWIENEAHSEVEIKCTPDHKFLVKGKNNEIWVEAKDLSRGMYLVNDENDYDIVIYRDTEFLDEKSDVYCLTVDETHTLELLHGVVVHNCGMTAVKLKEKRIDLPKLDSVIKKYVPSGFSIHDTAICNASPIVDLRCARYVDLDRAMKSLGTLGGGNHFIEVDKDEEDNLWLVVHTGSRHSGIEVCNYYQELGYEKLKQKVSGGDLSQLSKSLVAKLKSEGRDKEISKELSKLKESYKNTHISVPQALAYVEGQDFDDYIHDMRLTQAHAEVNRMTIIRQIVKNMKFHVEDEFTTVHNYIDCDNMILRKGSISAQKGERVIIPMNMRDGSLICVGKGNSDWNYSAPHGAGRIMSRSQAKDNVSMSDYKESMKGIFTSCVNRDTIDESPMVYKPMQEIIDNIEDTVDVVSIIKPIYNFKAGGE